MMSSSLSPEKRSTEGEQQTHDNNQLRGTPIADSINSQPLAESLELWQGWPEFAYYLSRSSGLSSAAKQSGDQLELGAKSDESLLSAVNVLQLSNLPHSLYTPAEQNQQLEPPGAPTNASQVEGAGKQQAHDVSAGPHLPEFECQASNLHYDLRTLIKLYVPGALGAPKLAKPLWDEMAASLPSSALDWQVRSSEPEQAAVLWSAGQWAPLEAPADTSSSSTSSSTNSKRPAQVERPGLERYLLRAHQLAAAALEAQQVGSPVPSASNESNLVRSNLVALNIYCKYWPASDLHATPLVWPLLTPTPPPKCVQPMSVSRPSRDRWQLARWPSSVASRPEVDRPPRSSGRCGARAARCARSSRARGASSSAAKTTSVLAG